MAQAGEAGITEIGESCMGLIGARRSKLYAGAGASGRGSGMPGRRERRPTLVVAEKHAFVQFLEATGRAVRTS
jgi:hypothetical protein